MRQRALPAQTLTISDIKNRLSQLVDEVSRKETRSLLERDGIPVAALVSVDDLARLQRPDREWDERTRAMERFSAAFADIPTEEVEAEIARIIAENRRQDEVERQTA